MRKVDIVIGIPSYNEAKSINNVVRQVDTGIQKYFKGKNAVLINADNNSPDKTGKIFLNLKTKTPKILISAKRKGKGINIYNILKKSKNLGAKAVMIADSDLKSIRPDWIKCLLGPALKKCDYVTPIYKRDESDGSITKHICYPLIYGLLGYRMRQPIGGEFGFSKRFINYLLKQKWDENTYKFGVDIFMSLNAIKGGFKLCEVSLGEKSHKPSAPNLKSMFYEVVTDFFGFLSKNKKLWNKKLSKIKNAPNACKVKPIKRGYFRKVKIDIGKEEISDKKWTMILYDYFYEYDKSRNKAGILRKLYPLFVIRMMTYIKNTKTTNEKIDEQMIHQQARYFYKTRNYLLEKYN